MSFHTPRVAIVDDDIAVLESTRLLLEIAGHHVETFASPCDFLAKAANDAFDCLILDQHMPQLTGLELARLLRGRGVSMPIMLITGSLTPDIERRASDMHLERVVEKPAPESVLMDFIAAAA